MTDHPYRLPRQVVPRHYRLRMEPDLEAATFAGSEVVTVEVVEATDRVVLNAAELRIEDARFVRGHDRVPAEVEYDEERQRAVLRVPEPLSTGPWELHCRFTGILNDQLRGFYRSTFTDSGRARPPGHRHHPVRGHRRPTGLSRAGTNPTSRRRSGSRWWSPDGSDGGVQRRRDRAETALAGDGKVEITFADTIEMSTYLVAFVVGPFEATEAGRRRTAYPSVS